MPILTNPNPVLKQYTCVCTYAELNSIGKPDAERDCFIVLAYNRSAAIDLAFRIAATPDRKHVIVAECLEMGRIVSEIAYDIQNNWKPVHAYAAPYVSAMRELIKITDKYILDSGSSVIAYALANMNTWRGEKAREVKHELNTLLNIYRKYKPRRLAAEEHVN